MSDLGKKGDLVPQPHGGALRPGGSRGPTPSVVRDTLRRSFNDRVPFLESVADGAAMQEIVFSVRRLVKHLEPHCVNCGEPVKVKADVDYNQTIRVNASASVKDRLAALDLMAKYGLGFTRELNVDTVRGKLTATIEVIRDILPDKQAEMVLNELRRIWK